MKIALIGYGKMGKSIEALAIQRGHSIVAKIDISNPIDKGVLKNAEVAIEFTQPDSVVKNLLSCFDAGTPVVCGTTGWLANREMVEKNCKEKNGTFFYASNFSLGVNLFFRLNSYLASLMNNQTDYNIEIDETHHTQKKDAPSGTAITLAEGIIENVDRKKNWTMENGKSSSDLLINSFREDPTPGTHVVKYNSPIDNIEIKHVAHSRDGFALGALMVAEWVKDKKGVLGMGDFLKL
jgi:4-hydroxy-tetrahydrodipicolinate reductase